jgi:hypothetical protein
LRLHVDVQVSGRTKPLSACRARARLMPLFNPLKTPMPRVSVHTSPPRLKTPNLSLLPSQTRPDLATTASFPISLFSTAPEMPKSDFGPRLNRSCDACQLRKIRCVGEGPLMLLHHPAAGSR